MSSRRQVCTSLLTRRLAGPHLVAWDQRRKADIGCTEEPPSHGGSHVPIQPVALAESSDAVARADQPKRASTRASPCLQSLDHV
jgi:hypothetical protein